MAGLFNRLGFAALLQRHKEELAAVWPAVRDGGEPPAPGPGRAAGLTVLLRTAARAVSDEGAPEHAVFLLAAALLHRALPDAVPPALRPLVDVRADIDEDAAAFAGRTAALLLQRAQAPDTPEALRPWCLDAALLCGNRCLRGRPADDPVLGAVHEVLSHAAELRFRTSGETADEDTALTHARAALEAAGGSGSDGGRAGADPGAAGERARLAGRLAGLLTARGSRTRDSGRMEDAVELARTALAGLDPAGPLWLAQTASAISTFLTATAREKTDVTLLDEALALQRSMREHPLYPRIAPQVHHLHADLLAQRYARRRDEEILQQAVQAYAELYAGDPARYAADLGRHLQYRYQTHGDPADRRRALELMARGLAGPHPSHEAATSFSAAAIHEYRESGDPAGIPHALALLTRLTEPGAPYADDSRVLAALFDLHLAHTEEDAHADYGPAEAVARRALATAGTPEHRAAALARLGGVLVFRYRATGDLALLDEAVARCREGRAALPPGTEVPEQLLGNLLLALGERHSRTRHRASLREAVDAAQQLADRTSRFGAEFPIALANLVTLTVEYARRTGDTAELDRARTLVERALETTAPGHAWRAALLNALGSVLIARTRLPGARTEAADTAVRHYEQALRDEPGNPRARVILRGNHAYALWMRHLLGGDRADLDRALEEAREVLRTLPPGDPSRGAALAVFSRLLTDAARAEGGHDGLREEAVAVSAGLAADATQPVTLRTAAALHMAVLAQEHGDSRRALDAARQAVELLPLLAWRGADRSDQEELLGGSAPAASFAAQLALAAGEPETALELLEAGRGVLAAQTLELRAEDRELTAAHPALAARLDELRRGLDAAAADGLSGVEADRRHRLAREWQETLDEIRAHDGFHDFLRPPRAGRLLRAGAEGSVVVVVVGPASHGGHALLLDGPELRVCPLPGLNGTEVEERGETLFRAAAAATRSGLARAFAERAVTDVLDWLWRTVAEPVLDALGITGPPPPGETPPRLWWCPTGALAFLPLHAAGEVPDRVVASYTPSVTALLRSRSGTPAAGSGPLIVAVPEAASLTPLPGALREARLAHAAVGGTLLSGEEAGAGTVRDALARHPWVHFACHGVQDPRRPSQGRLLLTGGALTVLDVARLDLPGAEFAYLSACETAVGGTALPDEALHLAGSLQLAGFSQVIGTLWRADDTASALIAQGVYEQLAASREGPPPAARALHKAVMALRERDPDRPLSWAAHVHSGA
ncbi:CHAT domain-containing protein [Streptomyces sp. NPDC053367]|uniref:CHAT domain-containing protein n=1 Tax=Streptomyces sp. NPDC053367 TaxID=3365700 RepID=UPI0037CF7516